MAMTIAVLLSSLLATVSAGRPYGHSGQPSNHDITEVDVAIVGGGASGMYAAVRLHQENKTMVVIETRNQTGGHVDTYIDPATSKPIDVGVIYYHNISVVTDFAAYLDEPLEPAPLLSSPKHYYVDFSSGSEIPDATINELGDPVPAYTKYIQLLSQYDYLISGFHLPSPVPEDFYMTWSQFITKYNLSGLAYNIDIFNQGWTNILDQPALYVLKGFGRLLLDSFISGYETWTTSHNNQQLYDSAVAKLGYAILTSSNVKHVQRREDGVRLIVKTPTVIRMIRAKKLLITIPPLLSNLEPILDLNDEERDVFGQFSCGFYWNAVVRNSGLSDDLSLLGASANNHYCIADQPGLLTVVPSGVTGLVRAYYASPDSMSDDEVSQAIIKSLHRTTTTLGIDSSNATVEYIRSHAPYHCTVSADAIKNGFYDRLEALQGKLNTVYTGATFQAHDSGSIWLYTERETMSRLLNM